MAPEDQRTIDFEHHRAERSRQVHPGRSTLVMGSSSCCSCLHDVPLVVGASIGSWNAPEDLKVLRRFYWAWIWIPSFLAAFLLVFLEAQGVNAFFSASLLLLFGFPTLFVLAPLASLVFIARSPRFQDRARARRWLGRLTLWAWAPTLIFCWGLYVYLSLGNRGGEPPLQRPAPGAISTPATPLAPENNPSPEGPAPEASHPAATNP